MSVPLDRPPGFVSGNVYDKYRTKNPVARALMGGFLAAARELMARAGDGSVLEVGCGPGDLAESLLPRDASYLGRARDAPYLGSDLSLDEVAAARASYPHRGFLAASIYRLPVPDRSFDSVVACEIFEHLDDPRAALAEVARVTRGHLLLSVPWEPAWRCLNIARGRYWKDLGNTPGHVQHFSRASVRQLVRSRFEILAERRPLPWTILLARLRS